MTYTYIEAKSNYHRGSILILRFVGVIWVSELSLTLLFSTSYLVLTAGFYWAPNNESEDSFNLGPLKATFQYLGQFFISL